MPFYGAGGGGPAEGRIVVSDSAGHTHLYDAEESSVETLPRTSKDSSSWHSPISVCVARNAVRADALYAINRSNSTCFKSLAYCNSRIMYSKAWEWIDLPPPPYAIGGKEDDPTTIQSYTLLDDNRTICFSSRDGGFGTYCFDTASLEWTKAGSWTLPFLGRALHVPQLHNLHFGFHEDNPEILAALELPSPLDGGAPPKVLHHLRGFGPPDRRGEWSLVDCNLLYLGNHRFCTAKFFAIFHGSVEFSENLVDMAAVLTGVEIVNYGLANSEASLQMIKHKMKTYIFDGCSIEAVL